MSCIKSEVALTLSFFIQHLLVVTKSSHCLSEVASVSTGQAGSPDFYALLDHLLQPIQIQTTESLQCCCDNNKIHDLKLACRYSLCPQNLPFIVIARIMIILTFPQGLVTCSASPRSLQALVASWQHPLPPLVDEYQKGLQQDVLLPSGPADRWGRI